MSTIVARSAILFRSARKLLERWLTVCMQAENASYRSGFEYAAGALLRGQSPQDLRRYAQQHAAHGVCSSFDTGIREAVIRWEARQQ
jgi:hypothetical protein